MGIRGEISGIRRAPFLLEEAGVCLAEPNNHIFNFENGYTAHHGATGDFHSGMRESPVLFHLAHEDVNLLTE